MSADDADLDNKNTVAIHFEPGEYLVVWSWDGAHRMLVSIKEATPINAQIEYGPPGSRHRKRVAWAELFDRSDGTPVTWHDMIC